MVQCPEHGSQRMGCMQAPSMRFAAQEASPSRVHPSYAAHRAPESQTCAGMCAQVLVIPLPGAESHTFVMVRIARELAERGHQVLVRSLCWR